jgi:hypothetical protein
MHGDCHARSTCTPHPSSRPPPYVICHLSSVMTYSACPRHVVFDLMGFGGDAPSLLAFADFTQMVYLTLQAVLGLEPL